MSYRGNYSRGNYRRGGGEGSWRGSRGNFTSSSRGRYYSSSAPSNYDSRNRGYFQGETQKYMNRGRAEESYRPTYRQEPHEYISRDFSMRVSPEPPRKRIRPDISPYQGGPSSRSHDRSYGSAANDYSNRSFYMSERGSGGGYPEDKGSYREIRESRTSDFSFRKPTLASRAPRGSFRGRTFSRGRGRGRGIMRSRLASRIMIRRKGETLMRKRYSRAMKERVQQLKLLKLKRIYNEKKNRKDDKSDEKEDEEEEIESGAEEEIEESSEENENAEEAGEKEVIDDEAKEETEVKKEDKEGEDENGAVKKVVKKKAVTKTHKKSEKKTKNVKSDGEEKSDEEKTGKTKDSPMTNSLGQPFIRLNCPQCHYKCVSFQEYSRHLGMRKHKVSMRQTAMKVRRTLAQIRGDQRQKQRHLDQQSESMNLRTFFCSLCKLNYRTLKSTHESTPSHKKMQDFLYPICRVCRISFRAPMMYESHICELRHIKAKARLEQIRGVQEDDKSKVSSISELDTTGFMVLDAVGSGEEESEEEKSDTQDDGEKKEGEKRDKGKKKKTAVALPGAEFCKTVEAYYCDLCKMHLPLMEDKKKTVMIHCRTRTHLQRWSREMKAQRRKAFAGKLKEKDQESSVEIKKEEDKEAVPEHTAEVEAEGEQGENEKAMDTDQTEEAEGNQKMSSDIKEDHSAGSNDQMWSEVDKDLTGLLHEEDNANKSSEEDDESLEVRYDKFRHDKSLENSMKTEDSEKNSKKPIVAGQPNGSISQGEKIKIEDSEK